MEDVNEGSRWAPPTPGQGGKGRDATKVAELLNAWGSTSAEHQIHLWFAGLGGELREYAGDARLMVADADPAIRSIWQTANAGGLAAAGAEAAESWARTVDTYRGNVRLAWTVWRTEYEYLARSIPAQHAVWAFVMFAGAINGIRRRNRSGVFNASHPPPYDPGWVPRRITGRDALVAADAWARDRILDVMPSFDAIAGLPIYADPRRVVVVIDPPYGVEAGNVYMAGWTDDDRARLVQRATEAAVRGIRLIVWCGDHDIAAWRGVPGMTWVYRPAKTSMKAPRTDKSGVDRPARVAQGGWMGWSA